jgi:hypothetical protein
MNDDKKPTRENESPNVEASGEMESAGQMGGDRDKTKGNPPATKPNPPGSRQPEREDDKAQYKPRTEPGQPSIEPEQEPYTRK